MNLEKPASRNRGGLFCSIERVTKEEFLNAPLHFWYSLSRPLIEDKWLVWEEDARFQDEVTYEFAREASKIGTLNGLHADLIRLAHVLPLARVIELYTKIRARSFWRESEFRPNFERALGQKMTALPVPLPEEEIQLIMLDEVETALLSKTALSDWNREEEDEAWLHLQGQAE